MQSKEISYRETGRVSKIMCDLFEDDGRLQSFIENPPKLENFYLQLEQKRINFSNPKRKVLVNSLKKQYANLVQEKSLVYENIERLSEENTFTITTGHQLNLMTGPLYFIYKIISTINLCKRLRKEYPEFYFVPIYWMATEDHDFEEISFFNYKGEKIKWHSEETGAVGRFSLKSVEPLFNLFQEQLGTTKKASEVRTIIAESYLSSTTLTEATRKLAHYLFKEDGLVILDGDDCALKKIFAPLAKQELEAFVCKKKVEETIKKIQSTYDVGYTPQVNPREINLFYLTKNERLRIVSTSNGFSCVNSEISWTREELFYELEEKPECFSPNVLMRPLYQETILPNICYIGGGGEIGYWLELKAYFDSQKILFPILLHRNAAVLVSSKIAKKIDRLNIGVADIFMKRENLINKKISQISDVNLDLQFLKQGLEKQFTYLESLVAQTDASFEGAVKAQRKKQFNGIDKLEKRLLKAERRKLNDYVQRLSELHSTLFPNENLQERTSNFFEFYIEYGTKLKLVLAKELDPLSLKFNWIILD